MITAYIPSLPSSIILAYVLVFYLCFHVTNSNMNNSAHPQSNSNMSGGADSEHIHPREAPPPYSASDSNVGVVTQPPIIRQTIVIQGPLKDSPMFYNCPKCNERVFTKVEYVSSKSTHMLAGFICGLTLWCMLCCLAAIPYYVTSFKKAEHYCPNCNTLLGTY